MIPEIASVGLFVCLLGLGARPPSVTKDVVILQFFLTPEVDPANKRTHRDTIP